MDTPTRAMAEYAVTLTHESLTPQSIQAATRHLIDSVACALGALDSRPAKVARTIADTASSTFGASVFGLPHRTTPEYAAFANTIMVRYLDFNDTGIGGHPSDMIPAVVALGEPLHVSGKDIVRAIHAEYEIVAALRRGGFSLRDRHVDQVQSVLGGVVGAGIILGLDLPRMANAISLAITPNIPLRVTRTGMISDWKGCATAP
jgi:2-methylcitrate dehydratase